MLYVHGNNCDTDDAEYYVNHLMVAVLRELDGDTLYCRGDWGPLGHGVHWDTPSSRKSPTYRAHEMPFSGSLGTPIVQGH